MEFERANHILFIGLGKPYRKTRTLRYIFDGWADEGQRRRFFGSIELLREEAAARRVHPTTTEAGIIDIDTPSEVRGVGTPIGMPLNVQISQRYSNPEKVENFFNAHRILIHRATSFEKPVRGILGVIREWIHRDG